MTREWVGSLCLEVGFVKNYITSPEETNFCRNIKHHQRICFELVTKVVGILFSVLFLNKKTGFCCCFKYIHLNKNPVPEFIDLEWDWLGEEANKILVPFAIQNGLKCVRWFSCWDYLMCNKTEMMVSIILPMGFNPTQKQISLDTAHSILLQVADNFQTGSRVDQIVCFALMFFFLNIFLCFSLNGKD
jgi:hypothetical protein